MTDYAVHPTDTVSAGETAPSSSYDVAIIGQGLAGTALAWTLKWAGLRPLVLDRDQPGTSSRVAAGLITPITGQRLVVTWRLHELWPLALAFYRRVEAETNASFLHQTAMIRVLDHAEERDVFELRIKADEFRSLVRYPPAPPLDETAFSAPLGSWEMPSAGRLDVPRYLQASREHLARVGCLQTADIDPATDISVAEDGVTLPRLGVTARWLVFCQGLDAVANPWFRAVRFNPAKGEVLTIRVPGLTESRIVHRGIWLAPLGSELFRAGATYEWQKLDHLPTDAGRDEIVSRLQVLLRRPFGVVDHVAAVRPIHRNQYPVVGFHPEAPRLGYINGLGSKGALHSPFCAKVLARSLLQGTPIDPDVDLNRRTELRGCRP